MALAYRQGTNSIQTDGKVEDMVKSIRILASGLALATFAAGANATVILPGSETPLQDVINSLYKSAGCPTCSDVSQAPDVNANQLAPDQLWSIEASGVSAATVIIEIAGNANSNTFGIYDSTNGNKAQLFGGPADQADQALVSISTTGQVTVVYLQRDSLGNLQTGSLWSSASGYFATNIFGYYLDTGAGTLYSDPLLNPDQADQMVAFQGDGDMIKLPGNNAGIWGSSSDILAWEDLPYNVSDKDFNDFVVYVESVHSVPEPGALALLAAGLLAAGIATSTRRRRQHA